MINELILILSDKQQAELIKRSLAANMDDDLAFLQMHINKWLDKPEKLKWTTQTALPPDEME